ncbi:uncharacterized protein CTRU02_211796 [Colletotrichum truncatum]|uniref:Uncharacterized protein n=1 Tax=Colletotrichum truncatum TaxID=5467 RepID=A0ACC3YLR8_COLTU|nr:uncharacterized protein CTRU02_07204 [Colletotrichum truncatum]KAF6791442.1 hypothetical protein CTRU02_07204 [Colletotrichum truncatum]
MPSPKPVSNKVADRPIPLSHFASKNIPKSNHRHPHYLTFIMFSIGVIGFVLLAHGLFYGLFSSGLLAAPALPSLEDHPDEVWDHVAPFIFDSVQGLLKQWPNSYAPNGHSVVAGTLEPATVLYHAKHGAGPPEKPTFFAFDAEMSVGIYGGFGESRLHVYGTTRTLNIIYLDGQSATLTPAGTLDSQMALLQGSVPKSPSYDLTYDDDQRAIDLCALVAELGIDGVVRMNAGFEVLICDYSAAKVEEIFVTNITVPGNKENENNDSLPRDPNRQPPRGFGNIFSEQGSYEWLRSATWHYGAYGGGGPSERRVKLDVCRLMSFYDPDLSSLVHSHHGGIVGNQTYQNGWGLRRGHRLIGINTQDVELARSWLKEITSPKFKNTLCSGIDWHSLFTVIRAQHGTRAKEIGAAFFWDYSTESAAMEVVTKIHELTHAMLAPYLEYEVSNQATTTKEQTISRCTSVYTKLIDPKSLARSEKLLFKSFKVVIQKLCQWEWDLFEWSERHTTNFLGFEQDLGSLSIQDEILKQRKSTEDLLAWIGWDTWTECDRQCAINELCTIPTWPVIYAPGLPQGGIYAGNSSRLTEEEMREFWRPKCVNRTDFDRGGGRGREPVYQFPDVPPYI